VYEGLCRSTVDHFPTSDKFVRLWRNEATRVFADKLINVEDRSLVNEYAEKLIREHFSAESEHALQNPLLYGDFMQSQPDDPDVIDPKIYQDCGDFEVVSKKFDGFLTQYNEEDNH